MLSSFPPPLERAWRVVGFTRCNTSELRLCFCLANSAATCRLQPLSTLGGGKGALRRQAGWRGRRLGVGEAELRAAAAPGGQATGRSAGLERPKDRATGRGCRGRRRRRRRKDSRGDIPFRVRSQVFWCFSFPRVQKILVWKLLRWGPNSHFMASAGPIKRCGAASVASVLRLPWETPSLLPSPSRPAGFRGHVGPASCTIRPSRTHTRSPDIIFSHSSLVPVPNLGIIPLPGRVGISLSVTWFWSHRPEILLCSHLMSPLPVTGVTLRI